VRKGEAPHVDDFFLGQMGSIFFFWCRSQKSSSMGIGVKGGKGKGNQKALESKKAQWEGF